MSEEEDHRVVLKADAGLGNGKVGSVGGEQVQRARVGTASVLGFLS